MSLCRVSDMGGADFSGPSAEIRECNTLSGLIPMIDLEMPTLITPTFVQL
jgi:hypothetical protein